MIQRYSDEYHDDVLRLVKEFQAESLDEYGLTFNDQALLATIEELKGGAFIAIIDGHAQGVLAGREVHTPASADRVWHEVIWFMSKPHRRYGLRLFNQATEWLKEDGFAAIVMVYMHNSKSDELYKLYTRLGLKPMETNFIGRL
jgi:hypothetical protein